MMELDYTIKRDALGFYYQEPLEPVIEAPEPEITIDLDLEELSFIKPIKRRKHDPSGSRHT